MRIILEWVGTLVYPHENVLVYLSRDCCLFSLIPKLLYRCLGTRLVSGIHIFSVPPSPSHSPDPVLAAEVATFMECVKLTAEQVGSALIGIMH